LLHRHEELDGSLTARVAALARPGQEESGSQAAASRRRPANFAAFFRVSRVKGCRDRRERARLFLPLPFLDIQAGQAGSKSLRSVLKRERPCKREARVWNA
jgi:hypothetical protein